VVSEYVTIKLPKNLVDQIDNFVGKYGFVSRTEVVKEAVRRLFQQYPHVAGQGGSNVDSNV